MFGLMKQARGMGGDLRSIRGSVLGSHMTRPLGGLDDLSMALAQLCAFALPQMSGVTMTALERVMRIEPNKKPDLRKFIAESYADNPSLNAVVRSFKRDNPRHNESYRLALSLCHVAREAGRGDKDTLARVIKAAKSLGLSKEEVLGVLQKSRLMDV